jgi:putative Mg2+ transporter-C (MgtC) family protein
MDFFVGADAMGQLALLARVAYAMLLAAVIGIEREYSDKPAGLRTHMLVAGASAGLVALGDAVLHEFSGEAAGGQIQADPLRAIEAVITGISFLGAGTIIQRSRRSTRIEGLTTAASILFAAMIGIAVAVDRGLLALGATAFAVAVLVAGRAVVAWIARVSDQRYGWGRGEWGRI